MAYVIAAVVLLLLIAGFVTFLVVNAAKKSGSNPGAPPPGIGPDETPLGDTTEHAGEQTERGATSRDPEQKRFERSDPDAAAHVARPGEGEGAERLEFEGEQPARDRDA